MINELLGALHLSLHYGYKWLLCVKERYIYVYSGFSLRLVLSLACGGVIDGAHEIDEDAM